MKIEDVEEIFIRKYINFYLLNYFIIKGTHRTPVIFLKIVTHVCKLISNILHITAYILQCFFLIKNKLF